MAVEMESDLQYCELYCAFRTEIMSQSRKQTPSDFLKQIIGRPVVVKLNSGIDYRGPSATCLLCCYLVSSNWRAPWKNRVSSTTMKLIKSLIKPVTWQNISSCLVLPPEMSCTMHLMLFSERPPIYVSSCMTISGGRTEQHIVIGFGELAAVD